MSATASSFRVELFWKGTRLVSPTNSKANWELFKEDSKYPADKMTPSLVVEYKMQLDYIEQKLYDYSMAHPNQAGKALIQKDWLKKVFKNDPSFGDAELGWSKVIAIWSMNIINLIEYGVVKENNNTGYSIIECDTDALTNLYKDEYDAQERQKLCGICCAPSNKKCPLCPQRYCCAEHQKSDWKAHKLTHTA
jgi:hypothetical protein